ncbi:caspase family protein [Streptomyces sp. NPDC023723]|uniref:HD domain-containing protein n=1 Tax=Streptomyces sp. NPDC023723 TaxID=3154323 RepID=UPI0033ECA4EA
MGRPARTALLIGVGDTPATPPGADSLDAAVAADLARMETVLRASHYDVRTLHNAEAGRSRIRTTISEVARAVPEDGTLLLYFTGHGIRVGDEDFLVPWDVTPPEDGLWEEPYSDSLLSARISPLLKNCRAATVLWLIDACRAELPDNGVPFGNGIDNGPPHGGYVVMTGCSPGQLSGFASQGSFFTAGLVDAFDAMTSARTVDDVFETARLAALAEAERHGARQLAMKRYGVNREAETRTAEVCEGQELLDAWRDAVRGCPLWDRVEEGQRAGVSRLRESLETWVTRCADTLHTARRRLPAPDPWIDDLFPVRLLAGRLPRLLPDTDTLSAIEAAVLVAAPFLHEAAWADRLSRAAEADPFTLTRQQRPNEDRRHYEQIVEQYGRMARKVAECRARARNPLNARDARHTQDATSVTMWLVHRWIAERFETDSEPVPTARAAELAALLIGREPADARAHELSAVLCAAAAAVGVLPHPQDVPAAPAKVLLDGDHQTLRIQPLAALLRLAGALAVDVRVFPEIVAEHLAVSDSVEPHQVIGIARQLSWERDRDALHLDVPCPHPALYAALTEVAEQTHKVAEHLAALADQLPAPESGLLAAVPKKVTARHVRVPRDGNVPLYETPPLRFHLAQTEVRELLMGEQLYGGEPQLALRELYQNAMDACRYRAMRWQYLTSKAGSAPASWSGSITISQGEDARGRYVECQDNGVGMSDEQLKYTFTRAGSRFEQSKAFRREQSRWLRHDPELRLYPNSRFGIGVFSYFMLADEMTIVTRQVNAEGFPDEHALQVDISSSGGLFRIKRHDGSEGGLPRGGTRIRLYLREGPVADRLSCVKTLRSLVLVSEFRLRVSDASGLTHTWAPRELHHPETGVVTAALEAVPNVLWWVPDRGAVLCDGLTTDHERFGYVVNLTGAHAGRLSVNRNELQDYDRAYVAETWRAGAAALAGWPELNMAWLWRLEKEELATAVVLHGEWRGTGLKVPRAASSVHDLDRQGWFHHDQATQRVADEAEHFMSDDSPVARVKPWRVAALGLPPGRAPVARPLSLEGHPVARPGDADISTLGPRWWDIAFFAAEAGLGMDEVLRRRRGMRVAHPRQGPPAVTRTVPDRVPDLDDRAVIEAMTQFQERDEDEDAAADPDDLLRVVLVSVQLALPLGTVVRRCVPYGVPGRADPWPEIPAHHEEYVVTAEDLDRLLVAGRDARVTTPHHVLSAARRLGLPFEEILTTCARFAWLGWEVPPVEQVTAWQELDRDVRAVLDRHLPPDGDGPGVLPWAATFDLAAGRGITLGAAEELTARAAARLGLPHERHHPEDAASAPLLPTGRLVQLIGQLSGTGGRLEDGVTLEALGRAAPAEPADTRTFLEAVAQLRAAGVSVPDTALITAWPTFPLPTRYVLSGKEASEPAENVPTDRLTTASLFQSAGFLHDSLREVWRIAHREAPRFGLPVPALPEELAEHRPTTEECDTLTVQPEVDGEYLPSVWQPVTPFLLAKFAKKLGIAPVTAYIRLTAFRALGALVPDLSPTLAKALPASPPTQYDLAALNPDHRVSPPDGPLAPLDLVSLAGQLGEPLPDTVRRIAPYLPLWPAPTTLPAVPGIVPRWPDLALLSRHFDGRLPAVRGCVDARHVTLAAEATGESEEWVRGRLRLYAAMFDLRLEKE